jgi:hypothetical protein
LTTPMRPPLPRVPHGRGSRPRVPRPGRLATTRRPLIPG